MEETLKISDLIKKLEKAQSEHGDIKIAMPGYEEGYDLINDTEVADFKELPEEDKREWRGEYWRAVKGDEGIDTFFLIW